MGFHPIQNKQTVTSEQSGQRRTRQQRNGSPAMVSTDHSTPAPQQRRQLRRRNALANFHLTPHLKAALEVAHMLQVVGDSVQRRASIQSNESREE
jgi:hypothetical protein